MSASNKQKTRNFIFLLFGLGGVFFVVGCRQTSEAPSIELTENDVVYDPTAFDHLDDGTLKFYLMMQDALVHDRLLSAQDPLVALQKHLPVDQESHEQTLISITDLKQMRAAFRSLSDTLLSLSLPVGYLVAHCPMAFNYEGAYWIQKEGKIMNPYYGSGMLHCGVFVESESGS